MPFIVIDLIVNMAIFVQIALAVDEKQVKNELNKRWSKIKINKYIHIFRNRVEEIVWVSVVLLVHDSPVLAATWFSLITTFGRIIPRGKIVDWHPKGILKLDLIYKKNKC